MSNSAAQACQAELLGIRQPSAQQLPPQHAPSTVVQQPSTAQQVAQTGEQAGAQPKETLAATTTTTQLQAAAVARQPQKQKRKRGAKTGGQEGGSEAATANDSDRKKKTKKQKKQSDKVAGAVATDPHNPVPTHAAVEEAPEAGAPAATQDADQAVAASDSLSDITDAGVWK